MQRYIKERQAVFRTVQIVKQFAQVTGPVFPYCKEVPVCMLPHGSEPVPVKFKTDMLYCVQAESIHFHRIQIPFSPVRYCFHRLRAVRIQICTHQIIKIDIFAVCLTVPFFPFKAEDPSPLFPVIPVCSAEISGAPGNIRINSVSSRKCKPCPCPDRHRFCYFTFPVISCIL